VNLSFVADVMAFSLGIFTTRTVNAKNDCSVGRHGASIARPLRKARQFGRSTTDFDGGAHAEVQGRDLSMSSGARIEVLGSVVLHIKNRLSASTSIFIGAAAGVTATARDVRIEVSGINGTTGALGATPPAASVGTGAVITALVLVPNGTLVAGTGINATGAFMARDLDFGGSAARITFQDGFTCFGVPDGTSCDDRNACTRTDTCQAGACVGGNAVTCAACVHRQRSVPRCRHLQLVNGCVLEPGQGERHGLQ
jgi:hypothetical protein